MSLARLPMTSAVFLTALTASTAGAAPAVDATERPPAKPSTLFREDPPEPAPAEVPAERPAERPAQRPPTVRLPDRQPPQSLSADRPPRPGSFTRPRTADPHPVPDPAAQGQARQLLRELFDDEYRRAESSPAAAKELTQELIRQAAQMRPRTTPDDVSSRYVLLNEAISLAAASNDFAAALGAARDLAEDYAVDGAALKLDLLARAGRETVDPVRAESLARAAVEVADEAVAAGDLPGAATLLSHADVLARKSKSVPLATDVQKRRRELRDLQGEYRNLAEAAATLRETHDDPAANLTLGRYHCFVAGNWDVGLPMLSLGADAPLRALASRDLDIPPTANARAELADGWWALAEQHSGRARDHLRTRAAYWYRQAMQDLGGLKRALAQKRIDAAPAPVDTPALRPAVRRAGSGPTVVVADRPPAGGGGGAKPSDAPAQGAADVLRQLAARFPPDARPSPGEATDTTNAHQWLRANWRSGTPIVGTVELLHSSGLQRHAPTNTPYVHVTFRLAETVEHAGIRHTMDVAAKIEDEKAMELIKVARGQIGRLTATITECRLGGWQGNKEKGLRGITFLVLADNATFEPGAP